jgi:hypothetical protein
MRRILLAMALAALMAVMAASSAAAQGPLTRGGFLCDVLHYRWRQQWGWL